MDDKQRIKLIFQDESIKNIMDSLINCPYSQSLIHDALLKARQIEQQQNQTEL